MSGPRVNTSEYWTKSQRAHPSGADAFKDRDHQRLGGPLRVDGRPTIPVKQLSSQTPRGGEGEESDAERGRGATAAMLTGRWSRRLQGEERQTHTNSKKKNSNSILTACGWWMTGRLRPNEEGGTLGVLWIITVAAVTMATVEDQRLPNS